MYHFIFSSTQLEKGVTVKKSNCSVDLQISAIKPANANWILYAFDVLSKDNKRVIYGFRVAVITDAQGC